MRPARTGSFGDVNTTYLGLCGSNSLKGTIATVYSEYPINPQRQHVTTLGRYFAQTRSFSDLERDLLLDMVEFCKSPYLRVRRNAQGLALIFVVVGIAASFSQPYSPSQTGLYCEQRTDGQDST